MEKPAAAAAAIIGEILHVREEDIDPLSLLRCNVSETRYGYRVRLTGSCAGRSTTINVV